ncbi:MAG: ParA family protein [Gammaproteobacteria bacterium]|nr:ParA family protein [Gammaproteobacteria bacterium]
MKVWAVANQKGGVGKTTTTVNLAGHLALQGRRVLLVDLDPHGSMTAYFGQDPDTLEKSAYLLFQAASPDLGKTARTIILPTRVKEISLLPASTALATLDRQLGTREGKGLVIMRTLKQLQDEYDDVLIDCPPLLGILLVNALAACEHLILPVQTEFLALKGLERMMHTLGMINKSRPEPLRFTIVPTMFDRRTRAAQESLKLLRDQHGDDVFSGMIPIDTRFREASKRGMPLSHLAGKSHGSLAYAGLLRELQNGPIPRLHLVNNT